MKLALCNEVLQPMTFAAQCEYAAKLGYDALELAPFTVDAAAPHLMSAVTRRQLRRAAGDAGVTICGLHWLLVAPSGLSITAPDAALRARTLDVMLRLVDLCADLGGSYLVHGSPAQRAIAPGESRTVALARASEAFAIVGERSRSVGVTYCVEPLARTETALINTVAEAVEIVDAIDNAALRTMIDTSAAAQAESESVAALIDRWVPTGRIGHVQLNDRNRRGPGQGEDRFVPIIAALLRHRYSGFVAIEPFQYTPDGPGAAARAVGYVRGIEEALAPMSAQAVSL